MASRNKILAIFYPYTFSHNQGQSRRGRFVCYRSLAEFDRDEHGRSRDSRHLL